jgi:hypothetical protein
MSYASPEAIGDPLAYLDRVIADARSIYGRPGELEPPVYDMQIIRPASVAAEIMTDPARSQAFRDICPVPDGGDIVVLPTMPQSSGSLLTTLRICGPETPHGTRETHATLKMWEIHRAGKIGRLVAALCGREPDTTLQVLVWRGTGQPPESTEQA